MSFEDLRELQEKYFQEVANIQLKKIGIERFNPRLPYTYFIRSYRLGPGKLGPYHPLAIVFDNDGVLTVGDEKEREDSLYKTVAASWANALAELRSRFRSRLDRIMDAVRRIVFNRAQYKEDQDRLTRELKEAGMTRSDNLEACKIASKTATLAPGSLEAILHLEKMGITPAQNSGSPKEALELIGVHRLRILPDLSEGTRFIYHKGRVVDSYSNVGFHKVESQQNLLRKIGCLTKVLVSDTPHKEDSVVFASAGHADLCIWVQRKGWYEEAKDLIRKLYGKETEYVFEGFEGKIKIGSEKFAEDLTNIIRPIEIIIRASIITSIYPPTFYFSLVNDSLLLRQYAEMAKKAKPNEFFTYRNKVLEIGKRLRRNIDFVFPDLTSDFDYHLDKLFKEIGKEEQDIERQKNLIEDIKIDGEIALAEMHFTDEEKERIRKIAEEFKARFPKFEGKKYV